MKRFLPLLLVTACLSGCGLRPLYSGGSQGAVAQSLRDIEVAPIEGKAGWLVRNAITDRLAAVPSASPRYRLVVRLDDDNQGFGVRTARKRVVTGKSVSVRVDLGGRRI